MTKKEESAIQQAGVKQFRLKHKKYRLSLQASLNGFDLSPYKVGIKDLRVIKLVKRMIAIEKARLREEGMVNGQTDLFLAVPKKINGEYSGGLYIEVKTKTGKPTPDQLEFIDEMTANGYIAIVVYGLDALIETLDDWMNGISR